MTYERRPFLPAVVSPRAAWALTRPEIVDRLEPWLRGLERSHVVANNQVAAEVRTALASMREAGRQWQERQAPGGSVYGTAEPQREEPTAESEMRLRGPGLPVRVVAEQLRVSQRRVTRLCVDGRLSATKAEGVWWIDPDSVVEYDAARRPVA